MVRPLRSFGCRKPTWIKEGGCQVIIFSHRVAVKVLIVDILDQNTFVCFHIMLMPLKKYTLVRSDLTKQNLKNCLFEGTVLLWKEGAVNLDIANPGAVQCQEWGL